MASAAVEGRGRPPKPSSGTSPSPVEPGDIFVIISPSASGKSTLLRNMIGLVPPERGDVYYDDASFWMADTDDRQ